MKFKKSIILLAILITTINCNAQITSAKILASGLTCSMCSNAILKSLEKVPFIDSVDGNVETSVFYLKFKNNSTIDLHKVQQAVEKAGFSVASFIFNATINNVKSEKNFTFYNQTFNIINTEPNPIGNNIELQWLDKKCLTAKEYKLISPLLLKDKTKKIFNVKILENEK